MTYLSPYDPPDEQEGLLPAIRRTGQRALTVAPGARWILRVLDHFYRQMSCLLAGYRYRRQTRREFHELMRGWHASDAESQAACRFCTRVHSLLTDSEARERFMMAVVAFAQLNTRQAVQLFAQRECEYIESYFVGLSVTL
jgi:hypothetical protein